jgi:magnesium transporter
MIVTKDQAGIGPDIRDLLGAGRNEELRTFLAEFPPHDIARHIEFLEPEEIAHVMTILGDPLGPDAFQKLATETQVQVSHVMPRKQWAHVIEEMDPDERTDLIKAMPEEEAERVLPLIAQAQRNDLARLMKYEEGTAGSIMTTEYAAVHADLTVREANVELRRIAPDRDTIYNLFVIDADRRLVGAISLKDLFVVPSDARLSDVMKADIRSINVNMDVEEVGHYMRDYDLVSVGVVDGNSRLVGIVTIDDVVDVVEQETTEDMYLFGAAGEYMRYFPTSPLALAGQRVIWLIVLVAVGFLSGMVLHRYQALITSMFALAIFIPVINASGGNAGTQASTVIIRGLATGEVKVADWLKVFGKELMVGLTVGVAVAVVAGMRGYLLESSTRLAVTVACAMVGVVTIATMLGALLPLVFKKLKLDPAVVSGPLIASILDVVALLLYLEIAKFVLKV